MRIDDEAAEVESAVHVHGKHTIGMRLSGPHGLSVKNVQLWLCPTCHLVWFEDLPDTYPTAILGGSTQHG